MLSLDVGVLSLRQELLSLRQELDRLRGKEEILLKQQSSTAPPHPGKPPWYSFTCRRMMSIH